MSRRPAIRPENPELQRQNPSSFAPPRSDEEAVKNFRYPVEAHFRIDRKLIESIPKDKQVIVPA